jgi:hypothetical protein
MQLIIPKSCNLTLNTSIQQITYGIVMKQEFKQGDNQSIKV